MENPITQTGRQRPLAVLAGAALALCVKAALAVGARPVVVELFTSQGCSSCPPAEAWIGGLVGRPDVLALTFHVDYWDRLGWPDRFAIDAATLRQENYARLLRTGVYTPQVVVDGSQDPALSYAAAVSRAVQEPRAAVPVTLAVESGLLTVTIGPRALDPGAGAETPRGSLTAAAGTIVLVPYLRHAISAIGRGENAGHTVEEFNIVRTLRIIGEWHGESVTQRLPVASLPADATDVAVLVQSRGQGPILGAAAHPLR